MNAASGARPTMQGQAVTEPALYDWASLIAWMNTLDARTRAAIYALTQEAIQRQDWVVPLEAYADPFEIIGRLDGLSALMVDDRAAVTAIAGSDQAREDMLVLLTYIEPLWRMRMSWDIARLRPDGPRSTRPSSLLDAIINFPVEAEGSRLHAREQASPEADENASRAGDGAARVDATDQAAGQMANQMEGMRRYLRILIGLVARIRLALDLVSEDRLDRVEAAVVAALAEGDASPVTSGGTSGGMSGGGRAGDATSH